MSDWLSSWSHRRIKVRRRQRCGITWAPSSASTVPTPLVSLGNLHRVEGKLDIVVISLWYRCDIILISSNIGTSHRCAFHAILRLVHHLGSASCIFVWLNREQICRIIRSGIKAVRYWAPTYFVSESELSIAMNSLFRTRSLQWPEVMMALCWGDPAMAQRAYEKGLEFVEQQILHSTDPQEKKDIQHSYWHNLLIAIVGLGDWSGFASWKSWKNIMKLWTSYFYHRKFKSLNSVIRKIWQRRKSNSTITTSPHHHYITTSPHHHITTRFVQVMLEGSWRLGIARNPMLSFIKCFPAAMWGTLFVRRVRLSFAFRSSGPHERLDALCQCVWWSRLAVCTVQRMFCSLAWRCSHTSILR